MRPAPHGQLSRVHGINRKRGGIVAFGLHVCGKAFAMAMRLLPGMLAKVVCTVKTIYAPKDAAWHFRPFGQQPTVRDWQET
jgi:hypothetical protein